MIGYQIPNNAFESLEDGESMGQEGKEKIGYKKGRDNYLDALKIKLRRRIDIHPICLNLKKKKI